MDGNPETFARCLLPLFEVSFCISVEALMLVAADAEDNAVHLIRFRCQYRNPPVATHGALLLAIWCRRSYVTAVDLRRQTGIIRNFL